MHAEKASACRCAFATCAGLGDCALPPPISCWQACWAAWNLAELVSMPAPGLISNAPWLFGSGKFATPCERMHRANATPLCVFGVRPPPLGSPPEGVPGPDPAGVSGVVV